MPFQHARIRSAAVDADDLRFEKGGHVVADPFQLPKHLLIVGSQTIDFVQLPHQLPILLNQCFGEIVIGLLGRIPYLCTFFQ